MYIKSLLPPNLKKHQTTQMGTKTPTTFKIFIQTNVMRVIYLHNFTTLIDFCSNIQDQAIIW